MKFRSYLQLIRWKNVALLGYLLALINWVFIPNLGGTSLEITQFILFSIAVLAIQAAGYCINDVFDREIDNYNHPEKQILTSEKVVEKALSFYKVLNVIGIGTGIWFSMQIEIPSVSFVFIACALLLYYYSKKLKSGFLLGNITISILVTIPVILLTAITSSVIPMEIWLFSGFVFGLTLVREIVKDCQDIKGDYKYGCSTLPIVLGVGRSIKIVRVLLLAIIISLIAILYFLEAHMYLKLYILILLILPLIWIVYRLDPDKKLINFSLISNNVKWLFFIGMNSIYFI